MTQAPPRPWEPGTHPDYTAFRVVINICQDPQGNVWSDHQFLTLEDETTAGELSHQGNLQVAHALLTEAVCREVFTSTLVILSQDPTLLHQWSEGRQGLEEMVTRSAQHVLKQTMEKMIPPLVPTILAMLSAQQTGSQSR
jgi:hypothetical protein